jgi:hypothetical protein
MSTTIACSGHLCDGMEPDCTCLTGTRPKKRVINFLLQVQVDNLATNIFDVHSMSFTETFFNNEAIVSRSTTLSLF